MLTEGATSSSRKWKGLRRIVGDGSIGLRESQLRPDHSMIGSGEWVQSRETEQLVITSWPEYLRLVNLRARIRQDVIDAQIAWARLVAKIAGVILWVRLVCKVRPALELCLERPGFRCWQGVHDTGGW